MIDLSYMNKQKLIPPISKDVSVVELFAGVGGFRLGLEGWKGKSSSSGYSKKLRKNKSSASYKVVWSNQWEPLTKRQHANDVYASKWHEGTHNGSDIGEVPTEDIPNHDLLVGGFPCQDYSVATTLKNSKGLKGKKGVLWWQIERILSEKGDKSPSYLMLENVDRLLGSPAAQRGRDFAIILASLADLGYAVEWRVINAAEYGMPQRRRRVFFIGYKKGTKEFSAIQKLKSSWLNKGVLGSAFPISEIETSVETNKLQGSLKSLSSKFNIPSKKATKSPFKKAGVMLEREYWTVTPDINYTGSYDFLGDKLEDLNVIPKEFSINKTELKAWKYQKGAKKIKRTNKITGHKYVFAEGSMSFPDSLDKPSRTIITGEGGKSASRFKHVVKQGETYRRLTPVELERLNMFPDNHTEFEDITDSKRAFFMGNALVVGVIERIGNALLDKIQ
jgi:DNA (cytosine-5)-methyltransferase 1